MKILCIVSEGGHFDEAIEYLDAFAGHEVIFVSHYHKGELAGFRHPQIVRTYLLPLWTNKRGVRLFVSTAICAVMFVWILLKERPDILFSTGAEICIAPFLLAKILGRKALIFVDTLMRSEGLSLTAKLVYPFCDLFLAASPQSAERLGPKASYMGTLV